MIKSIRELYRELARAGDGDFIDGRRERRFPAVVFKKRFGK